MRTIDVSEVTALVRKLCIDANYYLPADLREAFVNGQQTEQSPLGREIFGEMIANCDLARENNVPVCPGHRHGHRFRGNRSGRSSDRRLL